MTNTDSKKGLATLIITLMTALSGVIGTGIGATVVSNFAEHRLERQKFEYALIQAALASENQDDVIESINFLLDTGIIKTLNKKSIRRLSETPDKLEHLKNLPIIAQNARQTQTLYPLKRTLSPAKIEAQETEFFSNNRVPEPESP